MEWSSSSFDVVEVGGIDRITDRSGSRQQRHPQFQQWNAHMQRLGRALEKGDLALAGTEFNALVNALPEFGQAFPMEHPAFDAIGRAIRALDLAGARESFALLKNEAHSLHHHTQLVDLAQEAGSNDDSPPILDVTA
ncbi:MAG TPA: hypothetical protein VHA06_16370 [Candidatus Angelobacter sp.]|jgi:hypothetical protein|nr:hypothetical protein [Candidatus Angelobacter sp.]